MIRQDNLIKDEDITDIHMEDEFSRMTDGGAIQEAAKLRIRLRHFEDLFENERERLRELENKVRELNEKNN